MFSEKGYTAIEIDIDAAADKSLAPMVSELAFQIRTLAIPYPPLIFAQGSSTLLSQSFISDHPASGLVLVDPISPLEGMSEFTYEPTFPILVLASEAKQEDLHKSFRLLTNFKGGPGRGGRGVSVEIARDVRSHEARTVRPQTGLTDNRMWSAGWIAAVTDHVVYLCISTCPASYVENASPDNQHSSEPHRSSNIPFSSSCTCALKSSFAAYA